jgi:hypothetical protein
MDRGVEQRGVAGTNGGGDLIGDPKPTLEE